MRVHACVQAGRILGVLRDVRRGEHAASVHRQSCVVASSFNTRLTCLVCLSLVAEFSLLSPIGCVPWIGCTLIVCSKRVPVSSMSHRQQWEHPC